MLFKKLYVVFIAAIALQACTSSSFYIKQSKYDAAIVKSVKKLKKKADNIKEIKNLEHAYTIANRKDNDKINYLRLSGQPDIWDEVFKIYTIMKNRQEHVRVLPAEVLNKIHFSYVNYDEEIISAQKKAAEFYYTYGISLLGKGDRFSAREAYNYFLQVKKYYNTYKDLDTQIKNAYDRGQSFVAVEMTNNSMIPLPEFFESEFLKISLNELNSSWVNFETIPQKGKNYHYIIKLKINRIEVSPEMLKEEVFTESKEIDDGFQYVLDAKGNVMKDTAGNDIKVPKTKIITATVKGMHQKKSSVVGGVLDIYDNYTNQLLLTEPITAEGFFEHSFYSATGDLNALKPETKKKLGGGPAPFPPSPDMIMRTVEVLKNITKTALRNNKRLFK